MGFIGNLLGGGGSKYQAQNEQNQDALMNSANNSVESGLRQQTDFINQLNSQNALGNQSSVFNQQQGLANQLGDMAQGGGPNPAGAQLAQTTGQNVANQAALMAGQRGAGANAGMMARQAAQQGAATQQQAVGQAATQRAQQQLGAIGALQNQQSQMGNTANTMAAQRAHALDAYNQGASNFAGQQLQNMQAQNQTNSQVAAGNQKAGNDIGGQVLGGAASILTGGLFAHGGMADGYADGGQVGPKSYIGKFMQGAKSNIAASNPKNLSGAEYGGNQLGQGIGQGISAGVSAIGKLFGAGQQPVMSDVPEQSPAAQSMPSQQMPMVASRGAMVPGKAEKKGDSYANDKVPALLSPKEIVIPRSITLSDNAPDQAAKFVAAILAKNGMRGKK